MNNFVLKLKYKLAKLLKGGLVNENSNFREIKRCPSKRRQKESFKSKKNFLKNGQQLLLIVQEENGDRKIVSIEQNVSNEGNIRNNGTDNLIDNDSQNTEFDNSNIDYIIPLDLEVQELDTSFLQCESFIDYRTSRKNQPISRDVKIIMKEILEENRSIFSREDFLKPRNNFHKSDATDTVSLDLLEEEVDEIVVKQEELFIKDELFDSFRNNFHKSDATHTLSLDLVQEEVDETVVNQEELFIKDELFDRNNFHKSDATDPLSLDLVEEKVDKTVGNQEELFIKDELFDRNSFQKSDATDMLSLDLVEEVVDNTVANQEELFINDELFYSKRILDVLPTQDTDKAEKSTKKKDIRISLNKCNNSFNEFVKQAADSINYDTVECPSDELRISHLERCHPKPWYIICPNCDFRTNRLNVYTMHVEMVHSNSDRWKSRLVRVNATPLKTIYKCEFCDHSTLSKLNLDSHVKSVHVNRREFKCHLCEFSAKRISNLTSHLKCVHLEQISHNCNFCDYATVRRYRLKEHIETVHNSAKKFKCELCDYMSNVKRYLLKHQEVHMKKNKSKKKKTPS